ncbi:hypothetical protein PHAVU_005G155300 [Phaseolus vulgaris]|uniref:Uncharacterized protein n=1 Tax=Phaseolus vulgaris TaxID=3885 RepID=V7C0P0_PHAVU|nr:hypothetical protein PHAVU_005G155300g [Phaseolus vulgaris]ESW22466.1 hypothetical protein PHAVU_005G155300g [Phaseolus vulgaris]
MFCSGILNCCCSMMCSTELLYVSASTYSLICASQLAFNVVFSCFIIAQKFTDFIINSTMVLTLSAFPLAANEDSNEPSDLSKGKSTLLISMYPWRFCRRF